MERTIVIGAGASGLMAAFSACERGEKTLILEKNEKAGKKIYITGKGRCNVTNACDFDVFQKNILNGSRFMISSLRAFGPQDMIGFLEEYSCRTKTERGNRVFPVTDHASDVTKALLQAVLSKGAELKLYTEVTAIRKDENGFTVTASEKGKRVLFQASKVIVCTGGLSYPSTGSTGDGYRFAEEMGHTVRKCSPSLVQIHTKEATEPLAGVSLLNTGLTVRAVNDGKAQGKELFHEIGEILFTHQGVSGPLVLSVSAVFSTELSEGKEYELSIDLKPGLTREELDKRILRDFEETKNTNIGNALSKLLISGVREEVLRRSLIPENRKVHDISRKEREMLLGNIKSLTYRTDGTGGFNEAVVTSGGVSLKEINPKNMESKIVPGLFFAGEVLDTDAFTGGFNLQIAWSTGHAAGNSGKEKRKCTV